MIDDAGAAEIRDAFDDIEEAYEFMLAYAAQGHNSEQSDGGGPSRIRRYLQRFRSATECLESNLPSDCGKPGGEAFGGQCLADSRAVRSVIDILLAQDSITSSMIDYTNGLIVMRSFLTDVFFVDQVLLPNR